MLVFILTPTGILWCLWGIFLPISGGDSKFALRLDVAYYQGSGSADHVESYYVDFLPGADGWQFASGEFFTGRDENIDDSNDDGSDGSNENYISYDCIRYIEVVCEFSNQPSGSQALFDNISVIESIGTSSEYSYDVNGNLIITEGPLYHEYYVYDEYNRMTKSANSRGDLVVYTYSNDLVSTETVYYVSGAMAYSYEDYVINNVPKTPKSRTTYTYDSYGLGLTTSVQTVQLNASEDQAPNTYPMGYTYSYNISAGSKIFGTLASETESGGATTRYFYNTSRGLLMAVINVTDGNGYAYTYDGAGKLKTVHPATATATSSSYTSNTTAERVTYNYDSYNRLSKIITASTAYVLTYDSFGNTSSIKAGDNTLASYTYNSYNGKLNKITYGNGYIEEYVYDALENLSEIWYTVDGVETLAYSYEYNADGSVYKITDHVNGTAVVHKYDSNGRVVAVIQYDSSDNVHDFSRLMSYDTAGRLGQLYYDISYLHGTERVTESFDYSYSYNADSTLNYVTYRMSTDAYYRSLYGYDKLGRVTSITTNYDADSNTEGSFSSAVSYVYENSGSYTTARVSRYVSIVNGVSTTYTYTYDDRGNITKIVATGGSSYTIEYTYDDQGQLVMEENSRLDKTTVYTYDNAGNIVTYADYRGVNINFDHDDPEGGRVYTYSTSAWGDLLTAFGGTSITYDEIGNPLSYYNGKNYTFSWQGRQLVSATTGGKAYTYTYDDTGLRRTKTVDGVTTTYYYDGSLLISEQTDTYTIIYIYDANGAPVGMQYRLNTYASDTWDVYWYEKNLQGDIVAVYNAAGTKLVSYFYDAWGNVTRTYHNDGENTGAAKNPFTYRGYYYDWDIGFYYLQSRYYDPMTCRFINADGEIAGANGDLHGYNMFAYCFNNPVNMSDPSGNWPQWLTGALNIVGGFIQMSAGVALGAAAGWTGIGAVAAGVLLVNGAATVMQGVGQAVNDVTDEHIFREDNIVRAGAEYVGESIAGDSGAELAGFAYDTTVTIAGIYAGKIALQQAGILPTKVNINNVVNNPADEFVTVGPAEGVVEQYCRTIPRSGYGKIYATQLGNGLYQIANGHHRVAALRALGYKIIKIYLTK